MHNAVTSAFAMAKKHPRVGKVATLLWIILLSYLRPTAAGPMLLAGA